MFASCRSFRTAFFITICAAASLLSDKPLQPAYLAMMLLFTCFSEVINAFANFFQRKRR